MNYLGYRPRTADRVYIADTAEVIGQVTIGDDCSVWPYTVIRGDVNTITIGKASNIQDGSILHVTHDNPDRHPGGYPLSIGNYVTVGHKVVLHGCRIEDFCLLGIGSIVLDGAHLEKHVFLGAGSLVTPGTRLESGYLYLGSPAVKTRQLRREEISGLRYSSENYVRLKDHYLRKS